MEHLKDIKNGDPIWWTFHYDAPGLGHPTRALRRAATYVGRYSRWEPNLRRIRCNGVTFPADPTMIEPRKI